jgi:uncharacterized protein (TIGR03066 family)
MTKRNREKSRNNPPRDAAAPTHGSGRFFSRRLVLFLIFLLAGAGTWAFFEFVVWNKIPSELVGKWDIVDGPKEYREAVFEFYRNGTMEGRVDRGDMLHIIRSTIQLDGKKLIITSRHPETGAEKVQVQTIRTLTDRELIVEDERGTRIRMRRAE